MLSFMFLLLVLTGVMGYRHDHRYRSNQEGPLLYQIYNNEMRKKSGITGNFTNEVLNDLYYLWQRFLGRNDGCISVPVYLQPFIKGTMVSGKKIKFIWDYDVIMVFLLKVIVLLALSIIVWKTTGWYMPLPIGAVINTNGTGGGNNNAIATWAGGVIPGINDDAVVLPGDTLTMVTSPTYNSFWSTNTSSVVGGGQTITTGGQDVSSYAIDLDGGLSGIMNVIIKDGLAIANINFDLVGTSGNLNDVTIITPVFDVIFENAPSIDGNLNVVEGVLEPLANNLSLNIGGDALIDGTLGKAGWTAKLTIGGDMSGTGSYLHGNQECIFSSGSTQHIKGDFTYYDLTSDVVSLVVDGDVSIVVEHTLTINATKYFLLFGQGGDSTLTLGTASASGSIDNAGTLRAHWSAGSDNSIISGANSGFYTNLIGAGIYDWSYGGGNGEVHLKWLNHKGTDATAKTTGGGGVTVILDGNIRFIEDFEIAISDTCNFANYGIRFTKTLTYAGTVENVGAVYVRNTADVKKMINVSGTILDIRGTGAVHFDGVCAFTGTIAWVVGTTDFLPYDASSILNGTGGITVPIGARFGATAGGNMGDGNPTSGWIADMTFKYFINAGTIMRSAGKFTISGKDGANVAWENTGTVIANGGEVEFTGDLNTYIINGNNTWNDLTIVVTGAPNYQFEGTKTQTITGDLQLGGADGDFLTLTSTDGNDWLLDIQGTQYIRYVDVDASDASAGTTAYAAFSIDELSNTNWTFVVNPLDSTITRINDNDQTLTWSNSLKNSPDIQVQRKIYGDVYITLDTVSYTPATYSDLTTTINNRYIYQVRYTVDGNPMSNWVETDWIYTTPAIPTNLIARDGSVIITWEDNSLWEEGFEIQRRIPSKAWFDVATVGANITTWTDTSGVFPQDYEYRIRAFRLLPDVLYSDWSISVLYTDAPIIATLTDENGDEIIIWPISISAKISEDAATEITITFPNRGGINTNKIKFNDLLELEENP